MHNWSSIDTLLSRLFDRAKMRNFVGPKYHCRLRLYSEYTDMDQGHTYGHLEKSGIVRSTDGIFIKSNSEGTSMSLVVVLYDIYF